MAGVMTEALDPDCAVVTAGTHVVEGQPMSRRTRDALAALGLEVDGHRSRQVTPDLLEWADLVVAMAGEHVRWVRARHPDAAPRTATLKRLCQALPEAPGPLPERLASLQLPEGEIEPWEDIPDPAGGEPEVYAECARELDGLVRRLVHTLST